MAQKNQTIFVNDINPPVFADKPQNFSFGCIFRLPAAPVAFDDCGGFITPEANDVRVDGDCANNYVLYRSFKASDGCGKCQLLIFFS